ncbi:MAG: DUF3575 domain-containing protein [Bacteroidales bacterium]|nr:DUF3575 domain-containing protein [Bacteroidales bacterium]
MKKLAFTLLVLLISTSSVLAQQDIKTNALGLFLKNYGIGYEYVINDEISAGGYINFSTGSLYLEMINDAAGSDYEYSNFSIMPEFRYYTNPDFGADKRYFGAYAIYQRSNWGNLTLTEYPATGPSIKHIYDMTNNAIGLGIIGGQKWVMNSGLYFETLAGFGRFMSSSLSYSDPAIEGLINTAEYEYFSAWDFRFQVGVGYRIGGY